MAINYSLSARVANPSEQEIEKKIYATAQYNEVINLNDLAAHIASHGSPFSKGVILGILIDTVGCIRENLLLGNKVQLGDMGAFYITLSSEGIAKAEDFTASLIKGVNVRWSPSSEFKDLLNEASFRQVATRELQAESRKEMKNQANVNATAINGDNGDDNGDDNGEDNGNDNPSGEITE